MPGGEYEIVSQVDGVARPRDEMIDVERREGLLASIHKNVKEGLFRSAPDDGFIYVTPSFAKLFGYESADDLRATWHQSDNEAH